MTREEVRALIAQGPAVVMMSREDALRLHDAAARDAGVRRIHGSFQHLDRRTVAFLRGSVAKGCAAVAVTPEAMDRLLALADEAFRAREKIAQLHATIREISDAHG